MRRLALGLILAALVAGPAAAEQDLLLGADMSSPAMTKAEMSRAEIEAMIKAADGKPVDLHDKALSGLDLSGLNLRGANLRTARLNKVNLRGADLSGANLEQAWFLKSDLSGAKLADAKMFGITARDANLTHVQRHTAHRLHSCHNSRVASTKLHRGTSYLASGFSPGASEDAAMEYTIALVVLLVIIVGLALQSFGINQEYERAVLFRLGRLGTTKGPGWYWLVPIIDRVVKVDTRTITVQRETQETITRDGVVVRVNAVLWYRAVDPARFVTAVEPWRLAVIQAAETGMQDAIGLSDLDQMLKDRIAINRHLLDLVSAAAERWGIVIDAVEIKGVDIPQQMQRAIAREAEAIREKRARIIKAEDENEAAQKLAEAASTIATAPGPSNYDGSRP